MKFTGDAFRPALTSDQLLDISGDKAAALSEWEARNAYEVLQRRLYLAVPESTTPEQIFQIQRAIDYAESLGIDMKVRFIR